MIRKVSLELGGNAPFIVFDDADLDKAVEGAIISKYRNNGQTCVCANRLYIQDSVYDAFAEKLKVAVAKLKIGNGLDEGTTTGPLIDDKAVAKVKEHIADALSKGATLLTGGNSLEGSFFEPTILVNVPKNAAVAKEETFGPLAPLFRFKDEAEVIAMANDTEFGLAIESEAATTFAMRVARAVDRAGVDAGEAAFARISTAVGKYWVCKRAAVFVNEAQECLGGAGYVEESMLPRLYRQAPLNSIWEGSGNIQCLDVLRALSREAHADGLSLPRIDLQR